MTPSCLGSIVVAVNKWYNFKGRYHVEFKFVHSTYPSTQVSSLQMIMEWIYEKTYFQKPNSSTFFSSQYFIMKSER